MAEEAEIPLFATKPAPGSPKWMLEAWQACVQARRDGEEFVKVGPLLAAEMRRHG